MKASVQCITSCEVDVNFKSQRVTQAYFPDSLIQVLPAMVRPRARSRFECVAEHIPVSPLTRLFPLIWHGAAAILEDGVDVPGGAGRIAFETFESNVLFVLRFMIDCGVVGGCWVSAPAGKYEVGGTKERAMLSTCQIDIHLNFKCDPGSPLSSFYLMSTRLLCGCCVAPGQE